jgi:MbtH protein
MTSSPVDPFSDEDRDYLVLANPRAEHSLWPATIPVPDGWTAVHGPGQRAACVRYVEQNWTALQPPARVKGDSP